MWDLGPNAKAESFDRRVVLVCIMTIIVGTGILAANAAGWIDDEGILRHLPAVTFFATGVAILVGGVYYAMTRPRMLPRRRKGCRPAQKQ